MLVVAVTTSSAFSTQAPRIVDDDHEILSLSLAVNRALCGTPSSLSTGEQIGRILFSDPDASRKPIRQVITERWGSVEGYCGSVTSPVINNENSLMLLEAWAWRVVPSLSVVGVGRVLLAVRAAMLLFFCVVCLRLGASVLLCFVMVDAAFSVLGRLQPDFGYSAYSFLLCSAAVTVALYPLMLSLPAPSPARRIVWPAVIGVWSAFVVNMRTSYLPLCAGLALLYVAAVALGPSHVGRQGVRQLQRMAVAVALFAGGYALFEYGFIPRGEGGETLARHTVFHPLVLSVGLPTNAFSESQGIEWDDAVGLTLAHRVDPSARYLSREYDRALATYYVDLWKRYPREMSGVYLHKAALAGTEMVAGTDVPQWSVKLGRAILSVLRNGVLLLSLPLVMSVVGMRLYLRRGAPGLLLVTTLGAAAAMLMLESMLIVPRYFLKYHSALLWMYCAVAFVLVQAAVNLWRRPGPATS
jgi:hypothetical protein